MPTLGKTAAYSGLGSLLGLKGKVESDIGKTGVVLFYLLLVCICVCVCVCTSVCVHACGRHMPQQRSEDNLVDSVLSIHLYVGLGESNSGGQAAWPVALPAELDPGYLF